MRSAVLFAVASCLIASTSIVLADETWTVVADSTMDGNPGFLVRTEEANSPGLARFLFEEAGMVRYYAEREDGSAVWDVLSGAQYLCPTTSMSIDDSWRFIDWDVGDTTIATVVAQEFVTTAAGTFLCYKVDVALASTPVTVLSSLWFSFGVGIIRQIVPFDEQFDLVYFNIVGGSGFFPLYIGNTWQSASFPLSPVSVDETPPSKAVFELFQPTPNPFNPRTTISFAIDRPQNVKLCIFDMTSKRIAALADRLFQAGTHSLEWEGKDLQGNAVASGTYLLRMVSEEGVAAEKMMLIR